MVIKLIIIYNILYILISIPGYYTSIKNNKIFWSDIFTSFIISLIWIVTSSLSIGSSGHESFNEITITFAFSLIIFNIRVFFVDKLFDNYRLNSLISFILSIILILYIRLIAPYI